VFTVVIFGNVSLTEWKLAKYPIMPLRTFKSEAPLSALGVASTHSFVFVAAAYLLPAFRFPNRDWHNNGQFRRVVPAAGARARSLLCSEGCLRRKDWTISRAPDCGQKFVLLVFSGHLYDRFASRTTYDGVIDQEDVFVTESSCNGVELTTDACFAQFFMLTQRRYTTCSGFIRSWRRALCLVVA
jgi:hypothetical protein